MMKLFQYSTVVKAIALCVALAFSTMTFAAETKCSKVSKANSTKATAAITVAKNAPSFLFVLQAKQGKIVTQDGKTYLVLKKTDVHHVNMFSDRPYRIVKTITGTALQNLWKVGKNSFEKDPSYAALSSPGQKAHIVVLLSVQVKGDDVIFGLSHGMVFSDEEVLLLVSAGCGGEKNPCSNCDPSQYCCEPNPCDDCAPCYD